MHSLVFITQRRIWMDYSGSLWQTLKPPLGHEPSSERVLRASWRNGSCSVRVDPGPCLTVWMEGIHNQEGRLFSRTCEDRVLGTHHVSVETRDMVLKKQRVGFLASLLPTDRGGTRTSGLIIWSLLLS